MKKYLVLAFIFNIFIFSTSVTNQRDLIVILDYLNQESAAGVSERPQHDWHPGYPRAIGAMTFTLLPALYQKAAPILVSNSLLKNVLAHKKIFEDFAHQDEHMLRQTYGERLTFSYRTSLSHFRAQCRYTNRTYQQVNKTIKHHIKTGTLQERSALMDALIADLRFNEKQAPPTLRHYTHPNALNSARHREMTAYLLCLNAPLHTDEYVIKAVNRHLSLLIPKDYLTTHVVKESSCSYRSLAKGTSNPVTDAEKTLGLKVNHLHDITSVEELMHYEGQKVPDSKTVDNLTAIFVTKKEHPLIPYKWNLYIAGHGLGPHEARIALRQLKKLKKHYEHEQHTEQHISSSSYAQNTPSTFGFIAYSRPDQDRYDLICEQIEKHRKTLRSMPPHYENILCSLGIKEFQQLLLFLNTEVPTSLLIYTSCFCGGNHLVIPYKKNNKPLELGYDIISATASDNSSFAEAPQMMIPPYNGIMRGKQLCIHGLTHDSFDTQTGSLALLTTLHFDHFFKALHKKTVKNYGKLLGYLHPYLDEQGNLIVDFLDNYAHLRLAKAHKFRPLHTQTPFRVFNQAPYDNGKPSVLNNIQANLLYQTRLPALTVPRSSYKAPAFISMQPGAAVHIIPALNAPDHAFTEIMATFMPLPDLKSPKVFCIKELICKSEAGAGRNYGDASTQSFRDVYIVRNVPTYESCMFQSNAGVYYENDQGSYVYYPLDRQNAREWVASKDLALQELTVLFPKVTPSPQFIGEHPGVSGCSYNNSVTTRFE